MSQSIISDNWSLQNISELLVNGIDTEDVPYIKINKENDSYSYEPLPSAVVSIEALFDFITDIIPRDQILVEESYTNTWKQFNSPLGLAEKKGVIHSFPFSTDYKKLAGPKQEFTDRLCITSDLKSHHKENIIGCSKYKNSPHDYLSQTLWGGAGMLARSFVFEKGYTPHPVRRRLFVDAGLTMLNQDSVLQVNSLIKEKRASVVKTLKGNDELYSLTMNIAPLPIRVIQESQSHTDIINIALQLRDEYQELRNWLGCYQHALSDGSYKDISKFKKILHSISLYIDSTMGITNSNSPTYSAGIGVLKVAMKGQPINTIQNQFGVRSTINKLIVSNSGNSDLRKLLGFFGHRNTRTGMSVLEHFSSLKS